MNAIILALDAQGVAVRRHAHQHVHIAAGGRVDALLVGKDALMEAHAQLLYRLACDVLFFSAPMPTGSRWPLTTSKCGTRFSTIAVPSIKSGTPCQPIPCTLSSATVMS